MLENIMPAVEALSDDQGDQSSANPEFVHRVAEKNVRLTIDRIRERGSLQWRSGARSGSSAGATT